MNNILCITNDIGYSAAGIVFETIINELQKECNVYILSPQVSDSIVDTSNLTILPTVQLSNIPWRVTRLSAMVFGLNIADLLGSKMQQRTLDWDNIPQFDCIISLVAQQKYFGLILGRDLSCRLNTKWVVYSVDAIPVPNNWGLNGMMRFSMGRAFRRLIKTCDLFLLANAHMQNYQALSMPNFQGKYGVVYTPSRHICSNIGCNNCQTPVFLYTGGVYRLRRLDILMNAFRRFLVDEPLAKMVFVGNSNIDAFGIYQDLISTNNVEVYGHIKDLSLFYEKATILLDLNADINNDVFLSSKIVNYLPIKKPILCISGENSPARNIFVDDESIQHCNYKIDDIYRAMHYLASMKLIPQSREKYIQMFSAQSAVRTLLEAIKTIL